MSPDLPRWAAEMRDLFRSGSAAQFLLHGNVFDVVPADVPYPEQLSRDVWRQHPGVLDLTP